MMEKGSETKTEDTGRVVLKQVVKASFIDFLENIIKEQQLELEQIRNMRREV